MEWDGTITWGTVLAAITALITVGSALYVVFRVVFRVEKIEEWIKAHQSCSDKHMTILTEVREGLAYLRGKMGGDE